MKIVSAVMHTRVVKALALTIVLSAAFSGKSFAATDWSAIQGALNATGNVFPGNVLRFELVRQDLSVTWNGAAIPTNQVSAVANGFISFKPVYGDHFFVDGALPALETELPALQTALRQNTHIHITAVVNHATLETPKLLWVHFEAITRDGAGLATDLATALATIHSPQLHILAVIGTNTVFDPSILPPKFLKLFEEGTVEQLNSTFAFYLPRPDEKHLSVDNVKGQAALGVGHSFYIKFPFSGGTDVTLNLELAVRSAEIQDVEDTLRAGGFTVTAQNSHFLNDNPHLYFIHAYGSGDGFTLGNTLYNAIQIIQAYADIENGHGHDHDD